MFILRNIDLLYKNFEFCVTNKKNLFFVKIYRFKMLNPLYKNVEPLSDNQLNTSQPPTLPPDFLLLSPRISIQYISLINRTHTQKQPLVQ